MKVLLHCTLAFTVWMAVASAADDQDFEYISNVPQGVSKVRLSTKCPRTGKLTKAMFTILPSPSNDETVKVSTYPANLVTVDDSSGDELKFTWNKDVAYDVSEGGIKVYFPVDQLKEVSAAAYDHVQVLSGFTSVNSLSVSSDAVLSANLTTLRDSVSLELSVSSDGSAKVLSSAPLNKLKISSDGKAWVDAPMVDYVKVSSDGKLDLKGSARDAKVSSDGHVNIDGSLQSGKISSDGRITVYGNVTGTIELSSDAKLYVGGTIEDSASLEAKSDARVYASSCNRVATKSDGRCVIDNDINGQVVVDVPVQPYTQEGTHRCWRDTFDWWWWALIGVAVVAFIVSISCLVIQRRRQNKETSSKAQVYPGAAAPADAYVIDVGNEIQQSDVPKTPYWSKNYPDAAGDKI